VKIFQREPTLYLAVLNAIVILVGTLGLRFITGDQAALVVAVINAIFGCITAYAVRPISPAVFTYAVGAVVALLASYGLTIPIETVAGINATLIAILALVTRNQVSPEETPVSNA
jgi:hypothetical protein